MGGREQTCANATKGNLFFSGFQSQSGFRKKRKIQEALTLPSPYRSLFKYTSKLHWENNSGVCLFPNLKNCVNQANLLFFVFRGGHFGFLIYIIPLCFSTFDVMLTIALQLTGLWFHWLISYSESLNKLTPNIVVAKDFAISVIFKGNINVCFSPNMKV